MKDKKDFVNNSVQYLKDNKEIIKEQGLRFYKEFYLEGGKNEGFSKIKSDCQ